MKNEISADTPLHQTSIIRTIMIDKKEYYLLYEHPTIPSAKELSQNSSCLKQSIGTFKLIEKYSSEKEHESKIYSSESSLLVSKTINNNMIANDILLIHKVVLILEGKYSESKEKFFLDEKEKKFKLCSKVQEGVNLVIFICSINIQVIQNYEDALPFFIEALNKHSEIDYLFNKQYNDLLIKEDKANLNFNRIQEEVTPKQDEILFEFSAKLNQKKDELISLKEQFNNDILNNNIDNENQEDIDIIQEEDDEYNSKSNNKDNNDNNKTENKDDLEFNEDKGNSESFGFGINSNAKDDNNMMIDEKDDNLSLSDL